MSYYKRFMLLGSGELGKEFVIAAKRLGCYIVAVGRYANAPAMQLADACEVIDMFNGDELEKVVAKHRPDFIVPEIEAINIDKLLEFERRGIATIVPCANAVKITMDRKALRLLAQKLGLKTALFEFASNPDELLEKSKRIGFPCVVKPLMSSSGKGQTICKTPDDLGLAWNNLSKSRGSSGSNELDEMIVEQFIDIQTEITVLTISKNHEEVLYCEPIGHVQSRGDYQESWQPAKITNKQQTQCNEMSETIVRELGGFGLWGAEFFITKNGEVYFSEISPRPHDTGMVTLANTQFLNEFELHLYAILGLDITNNWGIVPLHQNGASAAICDDRKPGESGESEYRIEGLDQACEIHATTKVQLFGKPVTFKRRRLGVVLSNSQTLDVQELRRNAKDALKRINIIPSQEVSQFSPKSQGY